MIRQLVPEARIVAPHSVQDSADGEEIFAKQEGQTSVTSSATRQSLALLDEIGSVISPQDYSKGFFK